MRKNKKSVWYMALLASAFLAACGNSGSETAGSGNTDTASGDTAGKTEIEFWSFWGEGGARGDAIEKIVEDFNNSQDEIVVKYVYQPWGDIWTKNLAAVAAGNPPDVIIQDINSVRQRAEADQSTNLQSYIDAEGEDFAAGFYPQLVDAATYEDEIYGIPFNTDTQVLFYNKDMFEAAGLDPEDPPATWAELKEYSDKLEKKNGDDFETIGFYPLWSVGADVWALNADGGVSWFDEEGNVQINTPEKIEAFEWIMDWQEYYGRDTIQTLEAEFGSDVADPFVSGLVAMRGQNINYYSSLKELGDQGVNFGVAQLPEKEEGSGQYTWGGGFTVEIPTGAENPDASWEFIKYLTSPEVQEYWGTESYDIMANIEANEALTTSEELDENGKMIYEVAGEALENTIITPIPLSAPDYLSLVNAERDEILLGNKTPEEALNDAQQAVEDLVEQNQ